MPRLHTLSKFSQWAAQHRTQAYAPNLAAAQIEAAATLYLLAPSSFLGLSFTVPIAQRLLAAG